MTRAQDVISRMSKKELEREVRRNWADLASYNAKFQAMADIISRQNERLAELAESGLDIITPSELNEQAYQAGFEEGFAAFQRVRQKHDMLNQNLAAIHAAAMCENGERTREVVQHFMASYGGALIELDAELTKMAAQYTLLVADRGSLERILRYTNDVMTLAKNYVVEGTKAAQDALRAHVCRHVAELQPLEQVLANLEKRGRKRSKAKQYIGQLAASYPEPERGQAWRTGVEIYRTLADIPPRARTEEQAEAVEELAQYFYPGTCNVAERTGLGTYIKRARQQTLELTARN